MMRTFVRATLLGATALGSQAAFAQAVPSPNEAAADDGGIKEIIVTARKTEETLSTAPIAVSAVTAETISEQGLNSIDDFARNATGISFSQAFGRSSDRPVIRGQSNVLANVQFGVETGAAYFVDGIYYQGDIQGFDPLSIERVEIIKGPQSALYGRNTYAGAINYITKPASDTFTASGRATIAEHNEYQLAGSVSGPLIPDLLGFRLGGRHFEYGGEYTNRLTGKKVGQEKTTSAYLTLDWDNGGDIKVRQRLSYQRDDDGPLAIFLQGAAFNNCKSGFRSPRYRARSIFLPYVPATLGTSTNTNQYFCGTIKPQPDNVALNTEATTATFPAIPSFIPGVPAFPGATVTADGTAFDGVFNRQWYVSQVADWDIGGSGFVLSSLTGYRDNLNRFGTDSDHSDSFFWFGAPVGEPAFANTTTKDAWDLSQEIRLASPQDRPIRGLVGVYYFKQVQEGRDLTFANPLQGDPFGTLGSSFNWLEDRAVFGALTVEPVEGLSITGEVRHQVERKRQVDYSSSVTAPFCAGYAGLADFPFTAANCQPALKETGTDPRVTIDYLFPGGLLLYGVYARGRKPGGFNGGAGVTATAQTGQPLVLYLPEKVESFEIGTKFDALNRRVRVSASAFTNTLTNIQLTSAIPNPNGTGAINSVVTNQGDGKAEGFELELQMAPNRDLNINMGVSYVDARFTSGCDADQFILNSGGLRPNFDTRNPTAAGLALCDISGNRLPLGSPWIVNGSVDYELPLSAAGSLWFNTNWSLEASKYVQVHNLAKTGDTFLLNARLGYRTENFTISVFGRNLTDEDSIPLATRWFDYRYGAGTTGLPAAATVTFDGRPAVIETGAPRAFFATLRKGRTFGAEASFNF